MRKLYEIFKVLRNYSCKYGMSRFTQALTTYIQTPFSHQNKCTWWVLPPDWNRINVSDKSKWGHNPTVPIGTAGPEHTNVNIYTGGDN